MLPLYFDVLLTRPECFGVVPESGIRWNEFQLVAATTEGRRYFSIISYTYADHLLPELAPVNTTTR